MNPEMQPCMHAYTCTHSHTHAGSFVADTSPSDHVSSLGLGLETHLVTCAPTVKLLSTASHTSTACLIIHLFGPRSLIQMPPLGPLSARHITVGLAPTTAQTRAVMHLSDLGRCPGMQSLWLSDEELVIPRRVLSSENCTLAFGI